MYNKMEDPLFIKYKLLFSLHTKIFTDNKGVYTNAFSPFPPYKTNKMYKCTVILTQ